jgi:DNA polymerase-3 subunit epsilon
MRRDPLELEMRKDRAMPPVFSPTSPVTALPLTFVDVETTGLDVDQGDRVCEVALLRIQDTREVARFSSLVQPQRAISARAAAVHGITDDMLRTAPHFPSLIATLRPLLHDTVLVAHNAQFDVRFLRHEFALAQQELPLLAIVDTLALAQAWYRFSHNSLEAIAAAYGLSNEVRHRALADVLTTWQIWQRFIADQHVEGHLTLAHVMHPHDRRSAAELEVLTDTLQAALTTSSPLNLRYKASNAEETQRVIQPLELQYERGYGYLRAYCRLRRDERHFRLDRIMELEPLSQHSE